MEYLSKCFCSGLCAAALSLSLLTGCGSSSGHVPVRPQPSGSDVSAVIPEHRPEPELFQSAATVTPLTLDREALAAFSDALLAMELPYATLDELYDLEGARQFFAENIQTVPVPCGSGIIRDGKVDREALLRRVQENNGAFDRHAHEGTLFYTELEDQGLLAQIVSLLAEGIEAELPNSSEAELAELDCVLGDLCIFETTGLSGAAVTMDNVLTVNGPMIEMIALNSGADDGLRRTIIHEAKHLMQTSCNENKAGPAWHLGICEWTEELERNPYYWSWILEAAAEQNTVHQLGGEALTYHYLIGYLETLDLAGVLSDRVVTGYDIDKKALTRDRAGVFQILGQDVGLPEEELVRMMLAMEITQKRVEDYPAYYKETYGQELSDQEYDGLRMQLRLDFLLNASRVFYLNLTQGLRCAEDPILEDVFYLLTLWEADLNYHLDYIDGTPDPELMEFMERYHGIQQSFFAALSSSGNMTAEELDRRFCDYRPFLAEGQEPSAPNSRLTWLSEQKKQWLWEKARGERMRYAPAMTLLLSESE